MVVTLRCEVWRLSRDWGIAVCRPPVLRMPAWKPRAAVTVSGDRSFGGGCARTDCEIAAIGSTEAFETTDGIGVTEERVA